MSHRKISSVMSTDVATVRANTTFKDIVRALEQRDVSAVPVVTDDGRILGVVSQIDLLVKEGDQAPQQPRAKSAWWPHRHEAKHDPRTDAATAAELMSTPAITVAPDATVAFAARELTRHGIKRMPVVDENGTLVGIVSRKDLLTVFLRKDEDIQDDIVRDVLDVGLGIQAGPGSVQVTVHDGKVTLAGRVELRSQASLARDLTRHVDGVVEVVDELEYRRDDSRDHTPSMGVDITHEPLR
jgi:CBS domain-containing protein